MRRADRTTRQVLVSRAIGLSLMLALVAAASLSVGGACTSSNACSPDDHGLGDAKVLAVRPLPGRPSTPGACARPRVQLIASEGELRAFYDELGGVPMEDGGLPDGGAGELPSVDFSKERIIVREGPGDEGAAWVVSQNNSAILGVFSCFTTVQKSPSCAVSVIAVPQVVDRAESRMCDPVRCGAPPAAPGRQL